MKINFNTKYSLTNNLKKKIAIPIAAMALTIPAVANNNSKQDVFIKDNKSLVDNRINQKCGCNSGLGFILMSLGTGFVFGYLFAGMTDPDNRK